jgi:hypothetical protein
MVRYRPRHRWSASRRAAKKYQVFSSFAQDLRHRKAGIDRFCTGNRRCAALTAGSMASVWSVPGRAGLQQAIKQ